MNQKEFKIKLASNRTCDLQELIRDLNHRVLKIEKELEDEKKALRSIVE